MICHSSRNDADPGRCDSACCCGAKPSGNALEKDEESGNGRKPRSLAYTQSKAFARLQPHRGPSSMVSCILHSQRPPWTCPAPNLDRETRNHPGVHNEKPIRGETLSVSTITRVFVNGVRHRVEAQEDKGVRVRKLKVAAPSGLPTRMTVSLYEAAPSIR